MRLRLAAMAALALLASCEKPEVAQQRERTLMRACASGALDQRAGAALAAQNGFENMGGVALAAAKAGRQPSDMGPGAQLQFKTFDGWWSNFTHDHYLLTYSYQTPASEADASGPHPPGSMLSECIVGGENGDGEAFLDSAIAIAGQPRAIVLKDRMVILVFLNDGQGLNAVTYETNTRAFVAQAPAAHDYHVLLTDAEPRADIPDSTVPVARMTRAQLLDGIRGAQTMVFVHSGVIAPATAAPAAARTGGGAIGIGPPP